MKKISEIVEKDVLNQPFLIKSKVNGVTQKGAVYASITLQDDSGTLEGKMWTLTPEQDKLINAGDVQQVECEILKYNNSLQAKIFKISPLNQSDIDVSQYVISSTISEKELRYEIERNIKSIKNDNYRNIIVELFKEYEEKFYQYPAASKNHHSFLRGLATHVLGMLKIGNGICSLYPQISRDLLISAIILHDLGKTVELSGIQNTEYTLEGKLTGHISIMHGKIMEVAERLNIANSEESILLRHCILSHHGKYEYGSPILPLVQEAEVLSFIDNLDARLNTLESALSQVEPGTFTPRIFALEQRSFYKPKN
ncbi:MAG: 3'-5' exoribonuclease YhaM family protein [Anaerorhabdus sp.]